MRVTTDSDRWRSLRRRSYLHIFHTEVFAFEAEGFTFHSPRIISRHSSVKVPLSSNDTPKPSNSCRSQPAPTPKIRRSSDVSWMVPVISVITTGFLREAINTDVPRYTFSVRQDGAANAVKVHRFRLTLQREHDRRPTPSRNPNPRISSHTIQLHRNLLSI